MLFWPYDCLILLSYAHNDFILKDTFSIVPEYPMRVWQQVTGFVINDEDGKTTQSCAQGSVLRARTFLYLLFSSDDRLKHTDRTEKFFMFILNKGNLQVWLLYVPR